MEIDRSYGAVVYKKTHERFYLLVHLASGNHWGHPKGHSELNETPQETARREIGEETGFSVDFVDGFFREASWELPDGRLKIVGYFLGIKNGERREGLTCHDGEILGVQWLPYAEARQVMTYETGKHILDEAESFISRAS